MPDAAPEDPPYTGTSVRYRTASFLACSLRMVGLALQALGRLGDLPPEPTACDRILPVGAHFKRPRPQWVNPQLGDIVPFHNRYFRPNV